MTALVSPVVPETIPSATPYLQMRGITKAFGTLLANDHVDLTVRDREIHAVVGENGAGKTTLMNILYGLIHPDSGEIVIDGSPVRIRGPRDAIAVGIGMVHQHFQLVPVMTVAENVVLGQEPGGIVVDRRAAVRQVGELSERFGLVVDPTARVETLPVGVQQRVELLKILYRGSRLLVFDEPTAVLTPQETDELFEILRGLVAGGKTVILITHKLNEVMAISERVTVLRQGRNAGELETAKTSPAEIARAMVGREVLLRVERDEAHIGEERLRLDGLKANSDRQLPALDGIDLTIRSGEIVGIAGVSGNGQLELAEVIAGLRPVTDGHVFLGGEDVAHQTTAERRVHGLAYIPEDRQARGLVLPFDVKDNLILGSQSRPPFAQRGQRNSDAVDERAKELIQRYDIRPPDPEAPAQSLSGGNQQKVVVARELAENPKVLVAAEPARGLDVGATEFIHRQLIEQRDHGLAILLISSELDEIFSLSDSIAVIYRGHIVEVVPSAAADRERIGLLMAGGTIEGGTPSASQVAQAAAALANEPPGTPPVESAHQ
ncbi:MAG: ABC transporter ATP-binding protein [Chloroflexi bacterium]|nr:ABC transporter ATP-binding protein [Chloroflexota bacterium]